MTPTVHILATCHDEAGLSAATLVFQTLRVGFPTAKVVVDLQGDPFVKQKVFESFRNAGGHYGRCYDQITHADWIRDLVSVNRDPFWICDTDIVFHESVEDLFADVALYGRAQPGFNDPATGCYTMGRLHTSLLRIDPVRFRSDVDRYEALIRLKRFAPPADYWAPVVMPNVADRPTFWDCGAVASHAVSCAQFGRKQNARFDHLHNATYLDEIAPLLPDADLRAWHAQVYANPSLLRGAYARQMAWFQAHAA